MDDEIKTILKIVGLEINHFDDINGMSISRELLLFINEKRIKNQFSISWNRCAW